MFGNYLVSEGHTNAFKIGVSTAHIIKFPWKTKINIKDGGVFAMRHMETYRGTTDFNAGFAKEGQEQSKQISDLRLKYLAKILLSSVNEHKKAVTKEVEDYSRLPDFEKEKRKQMATGSSEKKNHT